jgi:hypothetical protein
VNVVDTSGNYHAFTAPGVLPLNSAVHALTYAKFWRRAIYLNGEKVAGDPGHVHASHQPGFQPVTAHLDTLGGGACFYG